MTITPPTLRAARWAWLSVSSVLTAALTVTVVAGVLVPRVAGATPYTVLTGSMRPGLPPGTLVVHRPVSVAEIGVGDVIAYQVHSGESTVVTHRVVAQGLDAHGHPALRTQGDANPDPDADWVLGPQVLGEVWYAIPFVGYLATLLSRGQHELLSTVLAWLLLGYAGRMFVAVWRDRHAAGAAPRWEIGRA